MAMDVVVLLDDGEEHEQEQQQQQEAAACCCCCCCYCDSVSATTIATTTATTTATATPQFSVFQWIGLETAELLPPHITRYYNNLHQQVNYEPCSRKYVIHLHTHTHLYIYIIYSRYVLYMLVELRLYHVNSHLL